MFFWYIVVFQAVAIKVEEFIEDSELYRVFQVLNYLFVDASVEANILFSLVY